MMRRRDLHRLALSTVAALPWLAPAHAASVNDPQAHNARWQKIEADSAGRLGVAVLDTATGRLDGYRLDERFPMCSTFKWLAAAHVLHRVDQGQEQLSRRIRYGRDVLLPHSPLTEPHAGRGGMTLAELCHATITVSDNAAANLILDTLGGPAGLTAYARGLGDSVTRLDRREPALNESTPGDPRDTTSPRAMAQSLQRTVLGDALSPVSRAQLAQWLQATSTNRQRLGADLPEGWRLGSKTGTGAHGSTNDVGLYWPPGRAPIVVAVYLTESSAALPVREKAMAQVARGVTTHGAG
ncbi:MAG: Beta-lactamase [Paracidovorax wautersii]|uniref:Beta-lactamase n=1 Tax=Paracidovorax wautersii TaxID=1177982 RepID=A0A7V8FLT9_9BURK|nr:MAG: Beta-lactamase [Paracidovorax wautersii]